MILDKKNAENCVFKYRIIRLKYKKVSSDIAFPNKM